MINEKWLYFRTVATKASDDGVKDTTIYTTNTSVCIPASRLIDIFPSNDDELTFEFKPVKVKEQIGLRSSSPHFDSVVVNINTNKAKEVIMAVAESIKSGTGDPFIVVSDDVEEQYLTHDVVSCGDINIPFTQQGVGIHEYFEIVKLATNYDADGENAAQLLIKLPAEAIILDASITAHKLSDHNSGLVRLDYSTSSRALLAAGGTELVGAGVATSVPAEDLDLGSTDGTLLASVSMGNGPAIHRNTNETYFQVSGCEDGSAADTEAGQVGVYIKWLGSAAIPVVAV